jgi:hypothetical protein
MPLETASQYTVYDFIRDHVRRSPLVRAHEGPVKTSPLFRVHGVDIGAAADGRLLDDPPLSGWWSFLFDGQKPIGIAEVTLTNHAIMFAGVNPGSLAERAFAAVSAAESSVGDENAVVWFVRVAPIFFTALVVERGEKRSLVPVMGPMDSDIEQMVAEAAKRRIKKHSALRRRRSRPTPPNTPS